MFEWSESKEQELLSRRKNGETHAALAQSLGSTVSAVKHKIRRLEQAKNDDRYKHTREKTDFAQKVLAEFKPVKILETHAGFGGMTQYYNSLAPTVSLEIDPSRVDFIAQQIMVNVEAQKADSEREVLVLAHRREKFSIVDVDPYGMPSRLFPVVLDLIDDGYLFVTLPQLGCTQINKITTEHYRAIYNIDIKSEADKAAYVELISAKFSDFGFWFKKSVEEVGRVKIGRIWRLAYRVKKQNLLDRVGLVVNRRVA